MAILTGIRNSNSAWSAIIKKISIWIFENDAPLLRRLNWCVTFIANTFMTKYTNINKICLKYQKYHKVHPSHYSATTHFHSLTCAFLFHHLPSFAVIFFHLSHKPSSSFISLHLPSSTFIYFHLPSIASTLLHLLSFSFICLHLLSFVFSYLHIPSSAFIWLHFWGVSRDFRKRRRSRETVCDCSKCSWQKYPKNTSLFAISLKFYCKMLYQAT